jgi:hypothetical protein
MLSGQCVDSASTRNMGQKNLSISCFCALPWGQAKGGWSGQGGGKGEDMWAVEHAPTLGLNTVHARCTRGACTVDAWCTHGACAVHARCMRSATCPAPRNIQTPFPPLKLDPNCVPSKARLAAKVGKWGGGHVNPPLKVACRKPPLTSPQGVLKRAAPASQPWTPPPPTPSRN